MWVYICWGGRKELIDSDLQALSGGLGMKLPNVVLLLYHLHNSSYYRSAFYYRIGVVWKYLIGWYRPGDRYFNLASGMKMGKGLWFAHPFATIINAESIGDNFHCIHCTTVGDGDGKPIIGDNVSLMANVTVAGKIRIGNNVTIGAGAVVLRDIPDNCLAAGVPARVIKRRNPETGEWERVDKKA